MLSFSGLQLSRFRKGTIIFIILTILWYINLFLTYKPNNEEIKFEKEKSIGFRELNLSNQCFERIKERNTNDVLPKCLSHENFINYLYCHLDTDLENKNNSLTLVIGSNTPLGRALVHELKKQNISYIKIKESQHINIFDRWSYQLLSQISIKNIIFIDYAFTNSEKDYILANLNEIFYNKNVRIYRINNGYTKGWENYEISFRYQHFGLQYLSGNVSETYKDVYYYRLGTKNITLTLKNYYENFGSALSSARFIIKYVTNKSTPRKVESYNELQYPENEVYKPLLNITIDRNNAKSIQEIYDWMDEHHNESAKTYASVVFILNLNEYDEVRKIVDLFNYYEEILEELVDVPLEILLLCYNSNNNQISNLFEQICNNTNVKSRLKIYSIKSRFYKELTKRKLDKNNEYLMNLATWISEGEYIFISDVDFYPSYSFFISIEKQLLTPMSMHIFPVEYVKNVNFTKLRENRKIESRIALHNLSSIFSISEMIGNGLDGMFGASKTMFKVFNGINDPYIFALSFYSLKVPPLIKIFGESQSTGKRKPVSIIYKDIEMQEMFCKGNLPSKHRQKSPYIWQQSYNFVDQNKVFEKFGHVAYRVTDNPSFSATKDVEIYTYFTDEL